MAKILMLGLIMMIMMLIMVVKALADNVEIVETEAEHSTKPEFESSSQMTVDWSASSSEPNNETSGNGTQPMDLFHYLFGIRLPYCATNTFCLYQSHIILIAITILVVNIVVLIFLCVFCRGRLSRALKRMGAHHRNPNVAVNWDSKIPTGGYQGSGSETVIPGNLNKNLNKQKSYKKSKKTTKKRKTTTQILKSPKSLTKPSKNSKTNKVLKTLSVLSNSAVLENNGSKFVPRKESAIPTARAAVSDPAVTLHSGQNVKMASKSSANLGTISSRIQQQKQQGPRKFEDKLLNDLLQKVQNIEEISSSSSLPVTPNGSNLVPSPARPRDKDKTKAAGVVRKVASSSSTSTNRNVACLVQVKCSSGGFNIVDSNSKMEDMTAVNKGPKAGKMLTKTSEIVGNKAVVMDKEVENNATDPMSSTTVESDISVGLHSDLREPRIRLAILPESSSSSSSSSRTGSRSIIHFNRPLAPAKNLMKLNSEVCKLIYEAVSDNPNKYQPPDPAKRTSSIADRVVSKYTMTNSSGLEGAGPVDQTTKTRVNNNNNTEIKSPESPGTKKIKIESLQCPVSQK